MHHDTEGHAMTAAVDNVNDLTENTEAEAALSPEDYDGKRVILTLKGFDAPFEATIEAGSEMGYIYKPKGKSNMTLAKLDQVEGIQLAPISEPTLKSRRLNPIGLETVKRHLVDRHGYKLTDINEMSSEDALSFHTGLEHADLSHFHADPPAKKEKGDGDNEDAQVANGDTGDDEDEPSEAELQEEGGEVVDFDDAGDDSLWEE